MTDEQTPDPDQAVSVDMPHDEASGGDSVFTVLVALLANGLLAAAKTAAAFLTGSAAMMAEAAHSWADTGNEVFLLLAERAGSRPRDDKHPRGYGRATYVWSLVAAFGLFSAGAVVSVWHGVSELFSEPGETSYTVNYVVLAVAFVLEGTSFVQASRQVHGSARRWGLHPLRFVSQTSNPTLRAVFFEDFAALLGVVIAGGGIALHQLTGSAVFDAAGSIAVGVLLAFVAVFLMRRNMDYLIGEGLSPELRKEVLASLLRHDAIERITYLHVEFVGPGKLFVVAAVDLTGDDPEPHLAVRLRQVETDIEDDDLIEDAILTLALPDEPDLTP
ncbi:MAG TPA: cation diffusion facilitator family transporter [Nocardioides sp.]|nr:cation diffusion facilitator family transporter [Nocardioides sp.]